MHEWLRYLRQHPVQRTLVGILELAILVLLTRALPDGWQWFGVVFLFLTAAVNLRVLRSIASNDLRLMASVPASRASGPSRA